LGAWLIGVDLLVTASLCLTMGKLVPTQAVAGTVSWVSIVTSNVLISAQLAGHPGVSVPAGLLVAASSVEGARLAHSSDGGVTEGTLLATQTIVAAAVMAVALRTERTAVQTFLDLQEAQRAALIASARREDERAQLRFVHNGPLTTLTMALHARTSQPSETLRQRADATLDALLRLIAVGDERPALTRLDQQIAQVIVYYQPEFRIDAELEACALQASVADAFAAAVAEALENVRRHAGVDRAAVELRTRGNAVEATITDQGRGFNSGRPEGWGFGLREDLVERLAAVGGTATVRSSPGAGTTVRLEWRDG
jgi:signal transduction histidine kinase